MNKIFLLAGFILPAMASSMNCYPQDVLNAIQTSVPFLNLTSNARIGAIGEIATVSSALYQDAGMIQNPNGKSRKAWH